LPLAIAFASKNVKTTIFDINTEAISKTNKGIMPFKEDGAEKLLHKVINKKLFVSSDPKVISQAQYVIVVIGTPVDEFLNPKLNDVFNFFKAYSKYFRNGQDLILRSTLYPGTAQKINDFFKQKGMKIGVSFCPERIAEGKALEEIFDLPQIVSSFQPSSEKKMVVLFKKLTNDVVVLKPMEAEIAKLFTNVWRYIQFAIPNQFLIIAQKYGLDFYKIFNAIKYKYPRAKHFSGPGFAAGPCLFKDTMQLAAFNNNDFMLGHAAMLVNEGLPKYLVEYLKKKSNLAKLTVGILGMAFKANNDDSRSSLSYKLRKILAVEAKEVLCTDVYIKNPDFVNTKTLLAKSDLVIVATPHSAYKKLRFRPKTKVLDVWNFYEKGMEF
jgi:UDP-N-acetyl-D-mannosaminuronic acid dehydrogenase